jgi:hypothetical protein
LLYEMGDPAYISPDCVARFDTIRLEQAGENRVAVSGIRGAPAPEKFKVSISFEQGYRAFGRLMVSGPDARRKAEYVAKVFWESAGGADHYADTLTQYVGDDSCHPSVTGGEPGEILLQVAARDDDYGKLANDFAPQLVPKVLSTVPGITYLADQGRPRPSGVVGYWPALISREALDVRVEVGGTSVEVAHPAPADPSFADAPVRSRPDPGRTEPTKRVRLSALCLARSGDKGDTCNVGVIARSEEIHRWMVGYLTAARVKEYFGDMVKGDVERFEVPNLRALNFLLHGSLGGGGTLSLLLDAQGKTYAQYLLCMEVEAWASICG